MAGGGGQSAELVGVLIAGERHAPPQWEIDAAADEVSLTGRFGALLIEQRHSMDESWTWRIRLRNSGEAPVRVGLVLALRPPPGWSRQCWLAGADGLITMHPPEPGVPLWAWRPRFGALASAADAAAAPAEAGELVLAERRLGPGEQCVVQWRGVRAADAAACAALLPSWLPERLELGAGEAFSLELPDAAVIGEASAPGLHRVLVHHGTGTTELRVSIPHDLGFLIEAAAGAMSSSEGVLTGAEAVVLLHAGGDEAVAAAEAVAQRPVAGDPLAVIAVAIGSSAAGWFDGVVPDAVAETAAGLPGIAGDLARLHVRVAGMVHGSGGGGVVAGSGMAPGQVLVRLGSGLPGEADGLGTAEVARLLAWAATLPEGEWARHAPGLAASPSEIFSRARSWALARVQPGDLGAESVETLAWLAIHDALVRG